MNNKTCTKFSFSLLHPKYWLTWFLIGLLFILVQFPYLFLVFLGKKIGKLSMHFLKHRVAITKKNIDLCFPELSESEKQTFIIKNFEATGIALFEIGIAWFWSDRRIKKFVTIPELSLQKLQKIKTDKTGAVFLGIHFLNLELGARVVGLYHPGIGVYRPNDNPVLDFIQTKGRLKSNKFMLDRKDLRGIIRALKKGESIWYAPDHDYGANASIFVPFFNVKKTATTTGTKTLMDASSAYLVPFYLKRNDVPKNKKETYILFIEEPIISLKDKNHTDAATFINQIIEKQIRLAPTDYMWLHRRFKTRPDDEPFLY